VPQRRLRTGSVRRVARRLPGGESVVRYERRKGGTPRCGRCGRPLPGLPPDWRRLPASSRKANRPFSNLCCRCSREALKERLW